MASFVTGVSCGGGSTQPTSDVVSVIPWGKDERLEYVLRDLGGRETARGVLTVAVSGSETRLAQEYRSGANSDAMAVVVDSASLKPRSATRLIQASDGTEEIQVSYTDQGAVIKQGDKQSGLSVPEHAYDNDSSLFLWRTVDLREGYSSRYVTIITNRRSRQTVDLRVLGKEKVSVAGVTFDAWKLEIKASNARQLAWIADTPSRTLVKYDNDRGSIWELVTRP